MGLLDDAIREHLELKRRSGAEDAEISRLETEAFGAGGAPSPQPAEPAAVAASEPFVEPEPVAVEEVPAAVVREEPPAPAPADVEPWLDEPDEVPLDEKLEHRRQPTTEFTPEEAAEAVGADQSEYVVPDEEPAEDLLEETPDFLQETPEHDRLWFEQKPPRDFDFGG